MLEQKNKKIKEMESEQEKVKDIYDKEIEDRNSRIFNANNDLIITKDELSKSLTNEIEGRKIIEYMNSENEELKMKLQLIKLSY